MVQQYLKAGARKIHASQQSLRRSRGIDPSYLAEKLEQRQQLESQCRRLRQEIKALQIGLKSEAPPELESPIAEETEKLRQAYQRATLLFTDTNGTVRQLKQRLRLVQNLLNLDLSSRRAALQFPQRARLQAKQKSLAESEDRLLALNRQMPSPKSQRTTAQIFREIEAWETEQLQWEEQLLQARIEERLCKGDGTAVLLQSPALGVRSRQTTQEFTERYAKTLKYLPLAPLLAILALAIFQFIKNSGRLTSKVESMLDAPVLAEFPVLSRRSKGES